MPRATRVPGGTGMPAVNPRLEDYQQLGELCSGSLSTVLLVRLKSSRQLFALKAVPLDAGLTPSERIQLEREGELLATVTHPFIVQLHHSFRDPLYCYHVLTYAPGGDLSRLLSRFGRINEPSARVVFASVTLALQYLHEECSIVYRDVKPENILLMGDGHVLLTDFNTARRVGDSGCETVIGTAEYAAPEVLRGQTYAYDADWWSAGVLLHEMLLGSLPATTRRAVVSAVASPLVAPSAAAPAAVEVEDAPLPPALASHDDSASLLQQRDARQQEPPLEWRPTSLLQSAPLAPPAKSAPGRATQLELEMRGFNAVGPEWKLRLPPAAPLSPQARHLLEALLRVEPHARLGGGGGGGVEVRAHPFFGWGASEWAALLAGRMAAPIAELDPAGAEGDEPEAGQLNAPAAALRVSSPQALGSRTCSSSGADSSDCSSDHASPPGRFPAVARVPSDTKQSVAEVQSGSTASWPLGKNDLVLDVTAEGKVWRISALLARRLGATLSSLLGKDLATQLGQSLLDGFAEALPDECPRAPVTLWLLHDEREDRHVVLQCEAYLLHARPRRLIRLAVDHISTSRAPQPAPPFALPRQPRAVSTAASAALEPADGSPQIPQRRGLAEPRQGSRGCLEGVDPNPVTRGSGGGLEAPAVSPQRALLHHLQRERGTSLAAIACGGSMPFFVERLAKNRAATDAAVSDAALRGRIARRRGVVDDEVARAREQMVHFSPGDVCRARIPAAFHKTLQDYNALVEQIMHQLDEELLDDLTAEASPLVSTLSIFSKLKDAFAMLRGFLTGMLAFPEEALADTPARVVADLVSILQKQWEYVAALQAKTPATLFKTLSNSLQLQSDELAAVHSRLVTDFDIMGVRRQLSVDRCWTLYSVQVDRLQQVEMGLELQLRAELARLAVQRSEATQVLADAALALTSADSDSAMGYAERLAVLPAAMVKSELLALLTELSTARGWQHSGASPRAAPALAPVRRGAGPADAEGGSDSQPSNTPSSKPASSLLGGLDGSLPRDFIISVDELRLRKRIGAGAAGSTYRAEWRGATVAVKVATSAPMGIEGWRAEVTALAQLKHPNVVRCYGVVVGPPMHGIVLEHCGGGDVRRALQAPTPPDLFWRVAEGVATGMVHIHSTGMLHRDLKSSNCLLDAGGGVKVSDFGLAVLEHDAHLGENGTYRWMAPEVVRREGCSKASDVYSFSMVLYELITHSVPFAAWSAELAAAVVAQNGARPLLPTNTPQSLAELFQQCWATEPTSRPPFTDVVRMLARVRSKLTPQELFWLSAPLGHRPADQPSSNTGASQIIGTLAGPLV